MKALEIPISNKTSHKEKSPLARPEILIEPVP
jgi:hypothetical protein